MAGLTSAFFRRDEIPARHAMGHVRHPRLRLPGNSRPASPDLARTLKFGTALTRLAARKPDVHKVMVEVQHLLKPRSVFRSLMLMARVMLEMVRS